MRSVAVDCGNCRGCWPGTARIGVPLSQALLLSTPTPGLWLLTAWVLQLREPPHLDPEQGVSLLSRLPGIFRPHWALDIIGEAESLEGGRRDSRQ